MFLIDEEELNYSSALPHQLKQRIQNRCNQTKNHEVTLKHKKTKDKQGRGKAQSLNTLDMFGHLYKLLRQIYFSLVLLSATLGCSSRQEGFLLNVRVYRRSPAPQGRGVHSPLSQYLVAGPPEQRWSPHSGPHKSPGVDQEERPPQEILVWAPPSLCPELSHPHCQVES